jgi:hypothetical protein
MSLDLASEIWTELKRYIGSVDRSEAADVLVNLLVDHDHDADEIRAAFKGDSDVKQALQVYSDSEADDVDEDYEDEDDEY